MDPYENIGTTITLDSKLDVLPDNGVGYKMVGAINLDSYGLARIILANFGPVFLDDPSIMDQGLMAFIDFNPYACKMFNENRGSNIDTHGIFYV